MRWYCIVIGIHLIHSIIDFAHAAPVLVQEKRQVVHKPEKVITGLGKRWDEQLKQLENMKDAIAAHFGMGATPSGSAAGTVIDHGSTTSDEGIDLDMLMAMMGETHSPSIDTMRPPTPHPASSAANRRPFIDAFGSPSTGGHGLTIVPPSDPAVDWDSLMEMMGETHPPSIDTVRPPTPHPASSAANRRPFIDTFGSSSTRGQGLTIVPPPAPAVDLDSLMGMSDAMRSSSTNTMRPPTPHPASSTANRDPFLDIGHRPPYSPWSPSSSGDSLGPDMAEEHMNHAGYYSSTDSESGSEYWANPPTPRPASSREFSRAQEDQVHSGRMVADRAHDAVPGPSGLPPEREVVPGPPPPEL